MSLPFAFRRARDIARGLVFAHHMGLFMAVLVAMITGLAKVDTNAIAAEQNEKEFPKQRFLRALTKRGEQSRHGALDEIERRFLSEPAATEVLVEALRQTDLNKRPHAVTLRVIGLLARMDDPRATDGLVALLDSSDTSTVMQTTDMLGLRRDPRAVEKIVQLQERMEFVAHYGFRKCVLHAVMRISGRDAVDFIVGQLRITDGALRRDIVHYLSEISQQRHGQNTVAWERWWNDQRERFRFFGIPRWSPPTAQELARVLADAAVSKYYYFDIHTKNMVFIIDRSSSMRTVVAGGGTRLDEAKAELVSAIGRLPETARFNVIFFDAEARAWEGGGLVPATDKNKQRAVQFITRMKPGSGTASYDALEAALDLDGNTEELFFVSDGRPTRGKIVNPVNIVRAVTEKNFLHRVSIRTVAIDAWGGSLQFMSELTDHAGDSFGASD